MSTAKVVTIVHPSSAVNNLVNDASGNVAVGNNLTVAGTSTLTGNVTATGTVAMGSSFKRNRIINGNMVVDQRNAGASVTPTASNTYTLDRWGAYLSQSSKYSVQQVSDGPTGFTKSLKVTSLSAYTVLATDFFSIEEVIEGYNVADLGWGASGAATVTLSFWVKSSLTGTFGGALYNRAINSYANTFSYTISAANTWEQKTVTITGPTASTWNTTNSGAINVSFSVGMGSNYQAAAGSWGSTTGRSVSGAVNVVSTNAATWQVTGVQLEVGTKATPYEMQIYSDQLAQCQRYCYVATLGAGGYGNGGATIAAYNGYAVTMRATPTLSAASITYVNASGLSLDTITAFRFRQTWSVSGTGGTDVTYTLTATAEL